MSSEEADDPCVYPGTQTLRNRFGIRDPDQLREIEIEFSQQRMAEPLPRIELTPNGYCALHVHIFQDVYPWAGTLRTTNLARDNSLFALPQYLAGELDACFAAMRKDNRLLSTDADAFIAGAAEHINEINARHPFREGNGRTQRLLLEILAERAGFHLAIDRIDPERWNAASVVGFHKADHGPMRDLLRAALVRPRG